MKNLIIAIILGASLASCSFNNLFYYPDKVSVSTPPESESIYIPWSEKDSIHGLFYQKEDPIASVFILHGNAGSLAGWHDVADLLYQGGYQTFIIDYPGFGNSTNSPTHDNVILSSQKAIDRFYSLPGVKDSKRLLMGFSLGGNLAVKMAIDNKELFDALLIEGAFSKHRSIAKERIPRPFRFTASLFVKNKIDAEELIASWTKPLLIVHSKDDAVCPYEMGQVLYNSATGTEQKELWTIKGPHLAGIGMNVELYLAKIKKLVGQ